MVDVSAIAGTVSALKGAMDISKAMIGLRDAQAMQAKVIELNSAILEAQSSAFTANDERAALIARVGQLEKEVTDLKAWEAEKQNYELSSIGDGVFAYTLKGGVEGAGPPHKVCANCYADGHKSILQKQVTDVGRWTVLVCSRCGSNIWPDGGGRPTHQPAQYKPKGPMRRRF